MITDPGTLAVFALAALLLAVVPGPAVLYIVAQSVHGGRRAGVASAFGIASGGLVHVLAAVIGLSALLAASAEAFTVVKLVGAAYLVWLGIRTLLSADDRIGGRRPELTLAKTYGRGVSSTCSTRRRRSSSSPSCHSSSTLTGPRAASLRYSGRSSS